MSGNSVVLERYSTPILGQHAEDSTTDLTLLQLTVEYGEVRAEFLDATAQLKIPPGRRS
ncbi:hypothetical protein [Mycolicibacter sinensis]|uniref:hypothetical protein n=1 Tax=Mycolicibacter sinensis (strain JDM601) TaxID=875328 RepID=UPI000AF8542C|nr:hypothetical protein [Mycolicibacter sinensis]